MQIFLLFIALLLSSPVGSPAFLPYASIGLIFHEDLLPGTFQAAHALGRILCPGPGDYKGGRNRKEQNDSTKLTPQI